MTEMKSIRDSHVLGSGERKTLLASAGVAAFLLLWGAVSELRLINDLLLPSPARVLQAVSDIGPKLILHALATLLRVCIGFSIGSLLGMAVGAAMQYNKYLFQLLDGIIETFRPVPPVAVVPFFILLFGFSETGKLLITVMGVGLLLTVTTVEAIERVPVGVIRWGLVVGLSRRDLFRMVILPAAWVEMRSGFRIALALAVSLVVVSEFLGATYGLGYLISVAKVTLTTPTLLLSIMLLGWLGWGLDRLVRYMFDKTTAWDVRAKGATK